MMIELGMPEDKIFEIASQPYNFNATSLDQMTTAGQFTANTIEKAINDSNEKTTYRVVTSNGGGHNAEAEAIQYLLNKGYTAEVLKKHFRMVQHSSWNWSNATEATARTIALDYTIRINDQNRYSGGQGGLVPLRASPILTSEKFAYAWYLTMGNGLFSDGAPGVGIAYNFTVDPYISNFAARRDCSDAGSHHFASNIEMMNEHWDKSAGYVSTSNITYGGYDLDQMLWQMVHPIARFDAPLSLPSPGHDTTLKAVLTGAWDENMHYTWSVAEASTVDGIPGGVFFSDSSSPETEVSFTRAGVYVIRLTAMDSQWDDSYTKTIVVQNNLLASQNGLTGYYFDNFGVDDNNVRHDFTAFKVSRVDPQINFETTVWESNPPDASMDATTWSVRWVGKINVPASDSYSFSLANQANDGARIFINGRNVADTWRNHPGPGATGLGGFPNATSEPITLAAGMHDIVVETYNTLGNASAVLSWSYTGQSLTVVPTTALSTR
jgi:hypothetical protein